MNAQLSALSTGATITSLLGLSGFIVACIFLIYVARTKAERNQIEKLKLLPKGERPPFYDDMLSRYGVTLKDNPDNHQLVLQEMNLRFRRQIGYAILGAVVFLVCFAILAFRLSRPTSPTEITPTPVPSPTAGKRTITDADKVVIEIQIKIEALRGDFEARHDNPGALDKVRREGKRLATLMDHVSDEQLNPSRQIIKDEYGGWALLLVARTYPGSKPEHRLERIRYAKEALERFDKAIQKMKDIERNYAQGKKFADEDYTWVMTNPDGPWNLTYYLKAMALAVIAEAGGNTTKEQIQEALSKVSDEFKAQYPPRNVPEFRLALESANLR